MKSEKMAKIEQAKALDDAAVAHIKSLPKDTRIVFHCHHGGRSQKAAEEFAALGYSNVHNLEGGIDRWSFGN